MKLRTLFHAALAVGMLHSACEKQPSKPDSPSAEPKPAASIPTSPEVVDTTVKLDIDNLLQSFGSAGPEEQSRVGKVAQAIRAENYGAALEILNHLLAEGHLTPGQEKLVSGFVAQLQTMKVEKR